jgi:hypothetical protein
MLPFWVQQRKGTHNNLLLLHFLSEKLENTLVASPLAINEAKTGKKNGRLQRIVPLSLLLGAYNDPLL